MRKLIGLLVFLGCSTVLAGQTETAENDSTIYKVVEEMPRFPACEQLDTTIEVKNQCAQQMLLSFMYENIVYPLEARQKGNEGTVVLSFVVEKDGTLSDTKVVKDVGGGCGEEALRILNLMNPNNIKWVPGKHLGKVVRTQFNLPLKFKLEEAPAFAIVDGDSVWTKLDEPLEFIGGIEALQAHLAESIDYPKIGNDSCMLGNIDVRIRVDRKGFVRILDITDYNNLGFDFWYEAIDASTSTYGNWKPAVFEGAKVPAAYDINLTFLPTAETCKQTIEDYQKASGLVNEGAELYNAGQKEEGIAKMTEGINFFPDDANFLLVRGQAYLDMKNFSDACTDLTKVRQIALLNWFDSMLPIICKVSSSKEVDSQD